MVPTQDIINIYKRIDMNVTRDSIEECALLFYGEQWIIEYTINSLTKFIVDQSQFLADNYLDFYIGGMDDMATMTQYYWQEMEQFILGKNTTYLFGKSFIQIKI